MRTTLHEVQQDRCVFHQVAHHPDLQVAKLLIHSDIHPVDIQEKEQPFSTISEDFEKLFQMSTLKEIRLCGEWIDYSQVSLKCFVSWSSATIRSLLPSEDPS